MCSRLWRKKTKKQYSLAPAARRNMFFAMFLRRRREQIWFLLFVCAAGANKDGALI